MSIELENIRGIPLIYSVKLKSSTKVPINLAGATIILKIRPNLDSTNVLVECTLQNGRIQILDARDWEFLINIEKEITVINGVESWIPIAGTVTRLKFTTYIRRIRNNNII